MSEPSSSRAPLLPRREASGSYGGESEEEHLFDDKSNVWELEGLTNFYHQSLRPTSDTLVVEGVDANVLKPSREDQRFTCVEFSPEWKLVVTVTSDGTFSVWDATNSFSYLGSTFFQPDQRTLKCVAFHPYDADMVLLCFDTGAILRTNPKDLATVDVSGGNRDAGVLRMKQVCQCEGGSIGGYAYFTFSSDRKMMVYYGFDGEFSAIIFKQQDKTEKVKLSSNLVLKQDPSIYVCSKSVLITSVIKSNEDHESSSEELGTLFWSGIDSRAPPNGPKPSRLKGKGYLSCDGEYVLTSVLSQEKHHTNCQIEVYRAKDLQSKIYSNRRPIVAKILYENVFFHKGKSYQQFHPFATRALRFESNHPNVECLDWKQFKALHADDGEAKPLIAIQQTNSVGGRLVFWDTNSDALIYEIDLTLNKAYRRFSEIKCCWSSNYKWLGVCSIGARMVGLVCARSGIFIWSANVPQIVREDGGCCTLRFDPTGTRLMISLSRVIYLFEPQCLSETPQNHPVRHNLCLTQTSNTYNSSEIIEIIKAWPKQVLFNILLASRSVEKIQSFPLDVAVSQKSTKLAMVCQKPGDRCFIFIIDYIKTPSMEWLWFLILQRWNQILFEKKVSVLVKEVEGEQGLKCTSVFYYDNEETNEEQIALFSTDGGIEMQDFSFELAQSSEWVWISDESCFSLTQSKDRHRVISLADRHVFIIDLTLKRIVREVKYSFGLSQWWESFLEDVKFFGHSDYYNAVFQECEKEQKLFLKARFRGLFDVSDNGETLLVGWDTERNKSLVITHKKSEEEFRTEYGEARESLCQCSMMTKDGQWLGFIDYESLKGGDIVACVIDTESSRQQRTWLGSDESLGESSSEQRTSILNFFLQVDDKEKKLVALGFKEIGSHNTLTQFSVGLVHDAKHVEGSRTLLEDIVQPRNLDEYGEKNQPSTFNMRVGGLTNFQRVLVEQDEKKAKDIAERAAESNIKISDVYLFRKKKELDPKTILSHALTKNDSSLVELCLCFIENGIFPFHSAAAMVKDSFFDLLFSYTELFLPILIKNSLTLKVGQVRVSAHYFYFRNDLSTYVFTSDTLLEWDERFVKMRVEDILESEKSIHRRWKRGSQEGVKVPTYVSFHCITNACKVGLNGIVRKLLMLDVPLAIFNTELIRTTINWKWERLWKRHCLHELYRYIVFLVFFTSYAIGIGLFENEFVHDKRLGFTLFFCLLGAFIMTLIFLFNEFMQLKTYVKDGKVLFTTYLWGFKHYFLDSLWNIVELISYFLVLVLIPSFHAMYTFEKCSWEPLFITVAIESILAWFKLWYYAQPFECTGPLVLLINNVIKDCFPFLILALVVLLGFSVAFYVLFQCCLNFSSTNREEYEEDPIRESFGSPWRSLSTLFYAMVGTFEVEVYYNHQFLSWLTTCLFILYMALEMIVMLNMLIAVMGDTYDKVKSDEDVQIIIGRARFIDAYEASLTTRKITKIEKQIGKFLYVLTPKENEYAMKRLNWKGKLYAIDENISKAVKDIKAYVQEAINANREEMENKMNQRFHQMESILQKTLDEYKTHREEHWLKEQDLLRSIGERIETLEVETNRLASSCSNPFTSEKEKGLHTCSFLRDDLA